MQKTFDFGAADNAAKRAERISERLALVLALAAKSSGAPVTRYKGYVGFTVLWNGRRQVAYVGNAGALRVGTGAPRDCLSYSPGGNAGQWVSARAALVQFGREFMARHDIATATVTRLATGQWYGEHSLDRVRELRRAERRGAALGE